jgi:hypothetical protein
MRGLRVAEWAEKRGSDHGCSLGLVDARLKCLWRHVGADLFGMLIERLVLARWDDLLPWLDWRWWRGQWHVVEVRVDVVALSR